MTLRSIQWQESDKPRQVKFHDVDGYLRAPGKVSTNRVRAMLTLDADKALEGVVLRYAAYAKLKRKDGSGEAVWVVPFRVEERRIPRLANGKKRQVPIDTIRLDQYLAGLRLGEYWPVELKLQVMVEPRKGLPLEKSILESLVPIRWE